MEYKVNNPYLEFFVNSDGLLIGKFKLSLTDIKRTVDGVAIRSENILLFNYLS